MRDLIVLLLVLCAIPVIFVVWFFSRLNSQRKEDRCERDD